MTTDVVALAPHIKATPLSVLPFINRLRSIDFDARLDASGRTLNLDLDVLWSDAARPAFNHETAKAWISPIRGYWSRSGDACINKMVTKLRLAFDSMRDVTVQRYDRKRLWQQTSDDVQRLRLHAQTSADSPFVQQAKQLFESFLASAKELGWLLAGEVCMTADPGSVAIDGKTIFKGKKTLISNTPSEVASLRSALVQQLKSALATRAKITASVRRPTGTDSEFEVEEEEELLEGEELGKGQASKVDKRPMGPRHVVYLMRRMCPWRPSEPS